MLARFERHFDEVCITWRMAVRAVGRATRAGTEAYGLRIPIMGIGLAYDAALALPVVATVTVTRCVVAYACCSEA